MSALLGRQQAAVAISWASSASGRLSRGVMETEKWGKVIPGGKHHARVTTFSNIRTANRDP
jgi:hypothetical protein